jgi:hypothetical protein
MSGLSKKRDASDGKAIYMSIIAGELKQKVTAETQGASKRVYKVTDKKTGVETEGHKWEIQHQDIFGVVSGVIFKTSDYGEQIVIKIYNAEDDMTAVITCGSDSRYGTDFMKKLKSLKLDEEICFNVHDFEAKDKDGNVVLTPKGKVKKITGCNITQDGKKVPTFYYDFEKRETINGLPLVDKVMQKTLGEDYWKIFFITEKAFLKGETEEYVKSIVPKAKPNGEQVEEVADTVAGEPDDLPF